MDHPGCNLRHRFWRAAPIWFAVALLLAGVLVALPGCSGCRKSDESLTAEELKKKEALAKKKKKKPEYQFLSLETLPSDNTLNQNFVKPGHAVTAWVPALANYEDLRAEFETSVTDVANRPVLIEGTHYHLVMSRPAVLPKGQEKFLESTFFIPLETGNRASTVFLQHELKSARGGRTVHRDSQVTVPMLSHQYLFAVLSTNPNAYGYVKQLESIRPQFDALFDEQSELVYYRVVLPSIQQRVPLPTHSFAWTMIAYVLWDGLQPTAMSPDQQRAMVDWLHWGGQLIVSGPGSLDALTGSFLDPYLPATTGKAVKLGNSEFETLNQSWSLVSEKKGERLALTVQETVPMIGVALEKRSDSQFVEGTGQLVAERRVGRGRVVVTAFSLADQDFVNWRSNDSFFNACLLRRPARRFESSQLGGVRSQWVGANAGRGSPLYTTATRYFTRDSGAYAYVPPEPASNNEADWHYDGSEPHPVSGLGGWNDVSGASKVAHQSLKEAAGILIPDARFVFSVLAIYLIVLVPVNWLVFRTLGHVEWAWVAAPIIAIVAAIAVIRLAQLDIGFVRSRTEIAVLEIQGGYPRAHLTRYTALYSSLSSNYRLRFEDTSAMARPFPPTDSPDKPWPVTYRRDREVELSGFQVRSSTTGYLHSEQMFETGGAIRLVGERPQQWQIQNDSDLGLHHVGVLYRTADGRVLTSWLDQLPAKTTAPLSFISAAKPGVPWLPQWEGGSPEKGQGGEPGQSDKQQADLEDLTELAARSAPLRDGDVRLVAWIDGFLPGLTVEPGASQTEARGVVLVHLQRGQLPAPSPDANISAEVRAASNSIEGLDAELDGAFEGLSPIQ